MRWITASVLALAVVTGCSSDGASTTPPLTPPEALARALAGTEATTSGQVVGVVTTENPGRFIQGDLQLRFDGEDRQSSVGVATNRAGLGAVVIDSSLVGGVPAQRWPSVDVWTDGDPRFPTDAITTQVNAIASHADDFLLCDSNIDGIDAYCATVEDTDLLTATVDAFNISRVYTAAGPIDVTVWVTTATGLVDAIFVEAATAFDETEQSDELNYELRYSLLGEPGVFSPIEIVCGGLDSELEYVTCMEAKGIEPAPPWNG